MKDSYGSNQEKEDGFNPPFTVVVIDGIEHYLVPISENSDEVDGLLDHLKLHGLNEAEKIMLSNAAKAKKETTS